MDWKGIYTVTARCEEMEGLRQEEQDAIRRLESAHDLHTFMPERPDSDPAWQGANRVIESAERELARVRGLLKAHREEHGC